MITLSLKFRLTGIFLQQYDSSSIPALLLKARTILGAEIQLQNINQQLETLIDQE